MWIVCLCIGSLGCRDQPTVATANPSEPPPERQQTQGAAPESLPEASQARRGPMISAEARDARVAAQTYVLGKHGKLFGDYPNLALPVQTEVSEKSESGQNEVSALDALPGSSGESGGDEPPAIDGNTLGQYVPLQLPKGAEDETLAHFYGALKELREGQDADKKVRILAYGASHTAADVYTSYLRAYLQHRFGDGGLGYVSLVKTTRWYRLHALSLESSKGWTVEHAQRSKARPDGYYGLLGASTMTTSLRDNSQISPRDGRYTVTEGQTTYDFLFLAQPNGGAFQIEIADKRVGVVSTKSDAYAPGFHTVQRQGGPHTIDVRPVEAGKKKTRKKRSKWQTDEVRLFGVTIENDAPGVVVDTLGIGGTRAANHLKWDEAMWTSLVQRRNPDLYILAYGTNEASDTDVPISYYKRTLGEVLDRFQRALPEASCLLVGPGDYQRKGEDGTYAPVPKTIEIRDAQREVALAKGCAFWDAMEFMGGVDTIGTWAQAEPAMAREDHIHLTGRGYLRMGMAVTDALMQGYDVAAEPAPSLEDTAAP